MIIAKTKLSNVVAMFEKNKFRWARPRALWDAADHLKDTISKKHLSLDTNVVLHEFSFTEVKEVGVKYVHDFAVENEMGGLIAYLQCGR